jgi:hypothetical protein
MLISFSAVGCDYPFLLFLEWLSIPPEEEEEKTGGKWRGKAGMNVTLQLSQSNSPTPSEFLETSNCLAQKRPMSLNSGLGIWAEAIILTGASIDVVIRWQHTTLPFRRLRRPRPRARQRSWPCLLPGLISMDLIEQDNSSIHHLQAAVLVLARNEEMLDACSPNKQAEHACAVSRHVTFADTNR